MRRGPEPAGSRQRTAGGARRLGGRRLALGQLRGRAREVLGGVAERHPGAVSGPLQILAGDVGRMVALVVLATATVHAHGSVPPSGGSGGRSHRRLPDATPGHIARPRGLTSALRSARASRGQVSSQERDDLQLLGPSAAVGGLTRASAASSRAPRNDPSRYASTTAGWTYDRRATAGVLPSCRAVCLTAATTLRCASRASSATPAAPEGTIREDGPRPGPEVLGRHVGPRDLAEIVVDVVGARCRGPRRPDRRTRTAPGRAAPGSAARSPPGDGPAGRPRGAAPTCRGTGRRIDVPSTRTCRPRIVVRPNDRLSFAYSSLPTRMSVASSSRTTAARTFSRDKPGRARSASQRRRMRGQGPARSR